jgi:hypothetical protein
MGEELACLGLKVSKKGNAPAPLPCLLGLFVIQHNLTHQLYFGEPSTWNMLRRVALVRSSKPVLFVPGIFPCDLSLKGLYSLGILRIFSSGSSSHPPPLHLPQFSLDLIVSSLENGCPLWEAPQHP